MVQVSLQNCWVKRKIYLSFSILIPLAPKLCRSPQLKYILCGGGISAQQLPSLQSIAFSTLHLLQKPTVHMYRGGGIYWEKIWRHLAHKSASHIEILPSTVKLVNDYDTSIY